MKRYQAILFTTLAFLPVVARCDQLAWIPRSDVEKVVKSIQDSISRQHGKPYYMVSYCSRSDRDHVEVWEVKNVVNVAIPETDYFQMHVFGRRILRSTKDIREGKYQEPIEYESAPNGESEWFLIGVDLAYVYIPSSDDSFRCVGKAFKLDCDVRVERIILPNGILTTIEKRGNANQVPEDTARKLADPQH